MPRIEAATVAEHREMRHRAVIDNAVQLYLDEGPHGVTHAAVAKCTGLARSSVYQYFATSGALIGAAVEELFSRYTAEVVEAVDSAGADPGERLAAYVRVSLASADRNHAASGNLPDLPEHCRVGLAHMHERLSAPLRDIMRDYEVEDVDHTTALAMGAVQGAVKLLDNGGDTATVTQTTIHFICRAVSCAPSESCCAS